MIDRHDLPEIELHGETLGVADLHLDPYDVRACGQFAAWTKGITADRLLVLGDLFDAWVGPAHESAAGARIVIEALRDLARREIDLTVLQGNRDFLLGQSFERASLARVCPEGLIGRVDELTRVLFLHGDELCTRDVVYQRLRRMTHSRLLQAVGPRMPLFLSRRVAARMRRASQAAVARKPSEEKAIQEDAVRAYAALHDCVVLVCGHAHAARDEELELGPRLVILDAFAAGERDCLRIGPGSELRLAASGATAGS